MTSEAEELFRAAAALPEVERAALVVRLLDSIAAPSDVVASQADESRRRLAAAQAGDVEMLDDDDAWRLISG
ncbi:MAG: addiction module protein [Deltaproteobacteria bacterium]|nr:addiction module protein [Deltaproteobacteria bacterium]